MSRATENTLFPLFKTTRVVIGSVIFSIVLGIAGCAASIPPDQLANYAVIIPRETHSAAVTEVDGKRVWALSNSGVNVAPAHHTVEMMVCADMSSICFQRLYAFDAKPGLAYIFKGGWLVNVEVFDRFHLDGPRVELLHSVNDTIPLTYMTDAEFQDSRQRSVAASLAAEQEQTRVRTANLPLVRKIGARVCQSDTRTGWVQVGYIEGLADEKVQIRIADIHLLKDEHIHPGGFRQSIIWDSPTNWDLCE